MIGPVIPEHLLTKREATSPSEEDPSSPSNNETCIESSLSEQNETGQQLDQNDTDGDQADAESEDDDADAYAPSLPPDLLEERQNTQAEIQETSRRRAPIGPARPTDSPAERDDPENDFVGPVLPTDYDGETDALSSAKADIEERARKSREAMEKGDASEPIKTTRPEWMIVPPSIDFTHTASSTKARAFSARTLDADKLDTSVWTDSPAERERKELEKLSGAKRKHTEPAPISAKELETRRNVEQYNRAERPMSLMEMHKKKKKTSRAPAEDVSKRSFDREKDLVASRPMNKKQKEELFKMSGELGSKFGRSGGAFL